MGGANGTKENLPVDVGILIEMAEYCEKIYDEGKEIGENEFAYNVVEDRGVTIISIRGTDNGKNVLTDLDARPFRDKKLGVQVHRGFRDASEKLKNDIIENVALEETIILTGHSLGGAIAQILGLWFEDDAYEVQIYTFGSPSIMMEQMWEDGHFRVYLENDPVPFLPPYPYVHWGIGINAETLDWDEDHPIGDITKIDARDHSIKEYLKILKRHK
jgi:hypothetical protein|tara:strand:+ start:739 stop:1386 length:648 start_codon:yes stop_codon:yes gene_type:complete